MSEKSRECICKVSWDDCSDIDIRTGEMITGIPSRKSMGYIANLRQLIPHLPGEGC